MTLDKLKDFHRQRLQVLVKAGPDLLAFETIPNKLEAQVCSCCCWLLFIFCIRKLCDRNRIDESNCISFAPEL